MDLTNSIRLNYRLHLKENGPCIITIWTSKRGTESLAISYNIFYHTGIHIHRFHGLIPPARYGLTIKYLFTTRNVYLSLRFKEYIIPKRGYFYSAGTYNLQKGKLQGGRRGKRKDTATNRLNQKWGCIPALRCFCIGYSLGLTPVPRRYGPPYHIHRR